MRRLRSLSVSILACAHASAASPVFPKRGDALPVFVPAGMTVETSVSGDLNGDGTIDVAVVIRGDESRYLLVAVREGKGLRRVGLGEVDAYPLGDASLSVKKGVLLFEDLTGGTSAFSSTYRYRYEAATDRMRLIGDDVTFYSRTNQHDKTAVSTNRLTGTRITRVGKLRKDAYLDLKPVTSRVGTTPLYLETAPTPEATIGIGG